MFKGILSRFQLSPCFIWAFPHGCLLLLPLAVFGVDLFLLPCPKAAMLGTALSAAPSCSTGGQERAVRHTSPQPDGCCCF